MSKILIADDNPQISSVLSEYLVKEGYSVAVAYDGEEAIASFVKGGIDLVLLDVMMPKKDGFEVCREIRRISTLPIIMVTARSEDFERIMGLDIGADDYIVKPFSPGEVVARIRALLRRITLDLTHGKTPEVFSISNLTIDMEKYIVTIDNQPVRLTKREMELLWTMAQNKGRVFSRNSLLDLVWGYDYYGDGRTVDSHIKRLRAKLDIVPHQSWEIATVWGVGYKFEVRT